MASRIIFCIAICFAVLLQYSVEAAHHNGTRHVRRVKHTYKYGGGNGEAGNAAGSDAGSVAGSDAGSVAGSDAGSVAGSDAGGDAGSVAGSDAGSDGQPLSVGYLNGGGNAVPDEISGGGNAAQVPTPVATEMAMPDEISGGGNAAQDPTPVATDMAITNAFNIGNSGIGDAADEVGLQLKYGAEEIARAIQSAADELAANGINLSPQSSNCRVVNAIQGGAQDVTDTILQVATKISDLLSSQLSRINRFYPRRHIYDPNGIAANHKLIHTINGIGDEVVDALNNAGNQVANAVGTPISNPTPAAPAPEVDPGFNREIEYIPQVDSGFDLDPGFNLDSVFGVDPGFNANPAFTHIITV